MAPYLREPARMTKAFHKLYEGMIRLLLVRDLVFTPIAFSPKMINLHEFSGVIPRLSNVPFILSLCILRYYPSQLYSIEKSGADCLSTTSSRSI